MNQYDSDSDLEDGESGVSTNVLLGYASQEPTSDSISQLGGQATWLDSSQPPSAVLAQCKICNDQMALLLQLNGELPDHFPGHDRRLYVWTCRRKTCQRKPGSIRALRSTRAAKIESRPEAAASDVSQKASSSNDQQQKGDLGSMLFGAKPSASSGNPFSTGNAFSTSGSTNSVNPFSTANPFSSTTAANPTPKSELDALPETFAEKARIGAATEPKPRPKEVPFIAWPATVKNSFPRFFLDADYEWLAGDEQEPKKTSASHAAFMDVDQAEASSSSGKEDAMIYEDTIDKTFQRYADTLAQNPEQVLRYEFRGQPLLYSRTDSVGVQLLGPPHSSSSSAADAKLQVSRQAKSSLPRCERCGAERVFEVQLTPHAITELEEDHLALGQGMEWGTIIVGVCGADCVVGPDGADAADGKTVVYADEWAGVQWEEVIERRR